MIKYIVALSMVMASIPCKAQDKTPLRSMDIKEALDSQLYKEKITSTIPYFFADSSHPEVERVLTEASSTRKINVTFKFGNNSCIAAFLETLAALQKTAERYEAHALINVRSSYEGETLSSSNNYLCEPGFFVAGVGLKADVVMLKK